MLAKRSFRGLQFHLRCQINTSSNALFNTRNYKNNNIYSTISKSSHHRLFSTTGTGDSNNNNGAIIPYRLADIGEGIFEVELLKWYVSPGDTVNLFDKICEVQSDKATVQITSRYQGTIHSLLHKEGDVIKVGEVLVDIDTAAIVKVIEAPVAPATTVTVTTPVTSMNVETTVTEITVSSPLVVSSDSSTSVSSIDTSYDGASNGSYSDASSRSIGNLFGDSPPPSFSSAINTTTTTSIANTATTDDTATQSVPIIADTTSNNNITPTTTSSRKNLNVFTARNNMDDTEVENSSINNTSAGSTSIDDIDDNSSSNTNTTVIHVNEVIDKVIVVSDSVTEPPVTESILSPTFTYIDTASDDVVPVEASATASFSTTDNDMNVSASDSNNDPSTTVSAFSTNSDTADDNQTIEAVETTSATSINITPVILASPAVCKLARDLKLRLDEVTGTGVNGRILKNDVMKSVMMNLNKRKSDSGSNIITNSKNGIANIVDSIDDSNTTTSVGDSMSALDSSVKDVSSSFTTTTTSENNGVINVIAGDDVTSISGASENITLLHESSLLSIGSNVSDDKNTATSNTTEPNEKVTEGIRNNVKIVDTSHTATAVDTTAEETTVTADIPTSTDVHVDDFNDRMSNIIDATIATDTDRFSTATAITATATVDETVQTTTAADVVKSTATTTTTTTPAAIITAADVLAAMINGISLTQTPVATTRPTTPRTTTTTIATTTAETTTSTNDEPLSLWHPSANIIATIVTKGNNHNNNNNKNNNKKTPSTATTNAATASIVNPVIVSSSTVGNNNNNNNNSIDSLKIINGSSSALNTATNTNSNSKINTVEIKPQPRVWTSSSSSSSSATAATAITARESTVAAKVAAASSQSISPPLSSSSVVPVEVVSSFQPSSSKSTTTPVVLATVPSSAAAAAVVVMEPVPIAIKPSSSLPLSSSSQQQQSQSQPQVASLPQTADVKVVQLVVTATALKAKDTTGKIEIATTASEIFQQKSSSSPSVLSSVVVVSSPQSPSSASVLTVEQQIQAMQPHRPWPTLSQMKTVPPSSSSSTLVQFNSNGNNTSNGNNVIVSNNLNRDRLKNNTILLTDSEARKPRSHSMISNNKAFKRFKSIYDTNNSSNSTNSTNNSADNGNNINGNVDVDDVAPVVVNSGTSPMNNNTTIKTTSTNATVTPTTTTINSNNKTNTTTTATTSSPTILGKVVPIRGIQRIMANNMTASLQIQRLTFCDEIYANELIMLKSQLMSSVGLEQFNNKQIQNNKSVLNKISYLPILIKMTSMALLQYPMLNATVNTACTEMLYHKHHNIGIAMDTKRGLIAPTIETVEEKSILEIAFDLQLLQEAAATGSLTEQHFRGASFTLSNIGSVGGTYAVPVVSVPQVAIGAFGRFQVVPRYVNKITKKIANSADVEIDMESSLALQPRSIMNISWSADHRVIDGATIAKFSNLFKSYVESPNSMMSSMK